MEDLDVCAPECVGEQVNDLIFFAPVRVREQVNVFVFVFLSL